MKQLTETMANILETGKHKDDRTGVGTTSVFGREMRFNLKDGFPATTTKKLAWKSVVTELLWFIEGTGDERRLKELLHNDYYSEKSTIWTPNVNADYWKSNSLFDGDLGLIYGNMWRKWPTQGFNKKTIKRIKPEASSVMTKDDINYALSLTAENLNLTQVDVKILNLWKTLVVRCYDSSSVDYKNYGACGYTMSSDWQNFELFKRQIKSIAGFYIWAKNLDDYDLDAIYYNSYQYGVKTSLFLPIYYIEQMIKSEGYVKSEDNFTRKVFYIDQLQTLIEGLKNSPDGRRHLLTAWNPSELENMGLPPCHTFSQFYVVDGKLSCLLYCRSQDFFLGTPFNIASYALFTHMIAQVCDLDVGELIHYGGDCHIYDNHVDQVKTQINRTPFDLPILNIKNDTKNIDGFSVEDFELLNYKYHDSIKATMAV